MAEGFMRSAKYEYRPAANLVLQSERDPRRRDEGTGEAQSLVGKLEGTRMGDRVGKSRPAELDEKLEKARKKKEKQQQQGEGEGDLEFSSSAAAAGKRKKGAKAGGFLSELQQLEGLSYKPKSKESRAVWEHLLTFVQRCLGDQPQEILAGAAEEVLAVLKTDSWREPEKKSRTEELLGPLTEDAFTRLTNMGKAIRDFHTHSSTEGEGGAAAGGAAAGAGGSDKLQEDIGVAVILDEEEDEGGDGDDNDDVAMTAAELEEGGLNASGAADDDDDVEGVETSAGTGLAAGDDDADAGAAAAYADAAALAEAEERQGLIPISKLDAYWLQRELSKYYKDARDSQSHAEEVMSILSSTIGASATAAARAGAAGAAPASSDAAASTAASAALDMREAENRLVALLDFDKFDLIKNILRNAGRIYFMTRLKQAQTEEEQQGIRREMAADSLHGGPAILRQLDRALTSASWVADRTSSMTSRVRKEAKALTKKAGSSSSSDDAAMEEEGSSSSSSSGGAAAGGSLPPILAAAEEAMALEREAAEGAAAGLVAGKPTGSLDLDSLSFHAGGHLMSNKKVVLPEKSWRAQKKGYEEVHVPALKPRPMAEGERRIPIAELPEWAQPAFKGMDSLNRVQSRLYETALFSPENMLLCAPTGAGKTNVAMLTIMHELGLHLMEQEAAAAGGDSGSSGFAFDLSAFKIVYVAPMKALVQEVVQNFSQRLTEPYGIVVKELSGDVSLSKAEIAETQIIVTTPEKWDVITRKAGDRAFTQLVRLIILDEVHLLHDERGPVLEALVARTLKQVEMTQEMVRIVGLSATLPNYEDVATFLRVDPSSGLFFFDNSYRPCPLQQQYIGITEKKPMRRWQLMNDICYEKTQEQAGKGSQVLVFVHSRKETAKTARALRDAAVAKDQISSFLKEGASREILLTESESTARDAELKELLKYGMGIHHAGMSRSDRTLVEELFADGHISVLVSTATLAWGVNLPAHTVIIKGTQVYNPEKGAWGELSPLDMMQMLGRAGRPQYDTFGEGIIITGHGELQYYLSLLNQQLPIESQMIGKLADNLNAEIVLGNISNVREAASWLGYTYLYVRMLRNPPLYGASLEEKEKDKLLLQRRLNIVHSAAALLDKHCLIRYDRRTGVLQSTALGRVASYYYIVHPTVAVYNEYLKPSLGSIELFRLFSLSAEFKNIVVRQEEKEELRKLLERVPIPVKESMEEPSAKVNVLLQAYISGLKLDGFALNADMVYVQQSAGRLVRAIFELCLRRGWALLAQKALALAKMIDHRQWESASPLRQFKGAGGAGGGGGGALTEDVLRRLERKEISWDRFYDLKPSDLGELVRMPKLGKSIHRLIHAIPRLELSGHVQPLTRSLLRVDLTLTPDFAFDPKLHGGAELFWVLVEDQDGEVILHSESFLLKGRYAEEEHSLSFYVPLTEPMPPHYFIRVLSDRWLHSETVLPLSFRHLLLPEKFAPPTELLDLAPLPLSALRNPAFQALYSLGAGAAAAADPAAAASAVELLGPVAALRHFNPLQTQTFPALYEGDSNAFVAAPSGSGKTVCAEFAILRAFSKDEEARIVYVAPRPETVKARWEEWELKFGQGLGKAVVELTGELASDLKLVDRAHIILATPRQWDHVSRRWKKRKALQQVSLFIADDLQSIAEADAAVAGGAAASSGASSAAGAASAASGSGSGGGGPVYEVIVSRMRFIAFQQQQAAAAAGASKKEAAAAGCRLLGLSLSVANARDLADWLGCTSSSTFSFHPQVRPIPLEIRLQAFDSTNFGARLVAMARPVYNTVSAACSSPSSVLNAAGEESLKQALVFVPSRKQAQLTAIDLITFATADNAGERFLQGRSTAEYLAEAVEAAGVRDPALAACLKQGVGIFHEGMRASDKALVSRLYSAGAIGAVVAPASAVWLLSGSASWTAECVVIMGTESFDGRTHSYCDYSIGHISHMTGRAGKPYAGPSSIAPGADPATAGAGKCVILCASNKRDFLKKFLYEPLPVESHLHTALHDHVNAEVVNGIVTSKQDALDYVTWSFLYRRLPQNPNYYNLLGTSHRHLSDFLSELVDTVVGDLEGSQCIAVEEETSLSPLNLGVIAAYYYISYTTLELFASSITAKTKLKGLLEILSNASEFNSLPMRHGEGKALMALARHMPLALPVPAGGGGGAAAAEVGLYHNPHTKANLLLQAFFSRKQLPGELKGDQARVLEQSLQLVNALVDVISSQGWLKPALAAMELSQMLVQGVWADKDSVLLQMPHMTKGLAERLESLGGEGGAAAEGGMDEEGKPAAASAVETVFDLMSMEDAVRSQILGLPPRQMEDIARFCNRYPNIDLSYSLPSGAAGGAGEPLALAVELQRDEASLDALQEGAGIGAVMAPLFPKPKSEAWWLVVGDSKNNAILAIKRVTLAQKAAAELEFPLPSQPGRHKLTLFFMCDSYLGCDQEYGFEVQVQEGGAGGAEAIEEDV